jgi:hypothetical protein
MTHAAKATATARIFEGAVVMNTLPIPVYDIPVQRASVSRKLLAAQIRREDT